MSVQRQYYTEDFSSSAQGVIDFQTDIYASDRGVALASANGADHDPVTGLTADGTYFVNYFFSGGTVDSQNFGYLREFRLTRSGNGSLITVETRSPFEYFWTFLDSESGSGLSSVDLAPNMDVAPYCNHISTLAGGVDGMEAKVPGSWSVLRSISGPLGPSGPTSVRTFGMRLLALKNLRAEKLKFDPNSEENATFIRGDVLALPAGTWQPTAAVAGRIDVAAFGPIAVFFQELNLPLLATIGPLGEVAAFEIPWNGTVSGKTEPAEGLFQVVARIIAHTPGVGTTKAVSKDVFVNAVGCKCKCETSPDGSSKMSVLVSGMPESSVGPSPDLSLAYCTASSAKPPASMGSGWQGKSSCRVFEPADQNGSLIYKSESGSYLRWNLVGGVYVPAFANNYVEIVKNASEPVYVVTFENQSVREFNAQGRLTRELDRNGQAITYRVDSASGDLLDMTDATGQVISFAYAGRTDGQPRFIRAATGREVELRYDSNDRLEFLIQPGDGATETTQFFYTPEGLLETMVLPSGLQPVVYHYDLFDRVIAEYFIPASTPDGFESVKETLYDGHALALADEFGLSYPSDLIVVGSQVTDLTGTSPGRLTFVAYDPIGIEILRDELVFPGNGSEPPRFNTTFMEYNDPLNPRLLTKQIAPNGFTLTMTYNAQGDLASVHESYSDTTTVYKYTEDLDAAPVNPKWRHLLREIHRPPVTVNGNLVTYAPTVFTYDPTYGNLIQVKDALGQTIDMVVAPDGLVEAITDRRGFTTTFAYNLTTRRLESVTTPGGPSGAPSRTTTFTFDEYLNLQTVTSPTLPPAQFTHDGQNRPKRTTSPLGFYRESNYLNGLLSWLDMPSNQGSGGLRRQTQFLYDQGDRLQQVLGQRDFVGSPVLELRVGYLYDGLSQLRNLVRLQSAVFKSTLYEHDFLGRLVRSVDFLEPGRETLIATADNCTGSLTTTPRGVQRETMYDERCRLRQLQTQDETHELDYDELNRLIRVRMGSRYAHGNPIVGGQYSSGFAAHETRFTHDELDRVVEVRFANGETLTYEHNENGDVVRMVDVHGRETLYAYYEDGRLLSVTYEGRVFTYTHDAAGRLASLTFPTSPDTLVLNFSWDDDGRLLSLEYLKNGDPFQSFAYTYDESGNRVTLDEVNPNSVTTHWDYGYDWFNRLTSVTKNTVLQESYSYDESDNRLTMSRPLALELWRYSPDLADQLNSITVSTNGGPDLIVESFTPDPDGNVIVRDKGGVTTEYEWDTMNRLRQVKVDGDVIMRSIYDAEGIRRLSKDDSGGQSKFFSSGGMSLADQRPGGPVSFMQGHQLLGLEQGGGLHFYITDGLGSVRLVVDATGAVEGAFDHDVWGNPDSGVTPPGAELRAHSFQGGLGVRNDTASLGLYYARQRYYSPELGRWLSADPIGFAGGFNLYTGMKNNPVLQVDPSGLHDLRLKNGAAVPHSHPPSNPKAGVSGDAQVNAGLQNTGWYPTNYPGSPPGKKGSYRVRESDQFIPPNNTTGNCLFYAASSTGLLKGPQTPFWLPWEGMQMLINEALQDETWEFTDTPRPGDLVLFNQGSASVVCNEKSIGGFTGHGGNVQSVEDGVITRSKYGEGTLLYDVAPEAWGAPVYLHRK